MKYNPEIHHRKSMRLKGYDYSQTGAYFVTICTRERECLFGDVVDAEMRLNAAGWIVQDEWARTAVIRVRVILDAFIVMPNHFHGIILIECRGTLQRAPTLEQFGKPTSDSIPTIIRLFKSVTTKRVNALRGTPGIPIWQRNYYEHIIRDESEFNRIREYVINNPAAWDKDEENPAVANNLR